MSRRIGRFSWLILAGIVALALLAWAWIDGGARAMHPISQPVVLPEIAR